MATQEAMQVEVGDEQPRAQRATVGFQLHIRMPGIRAKIAKDRVDLGDADADMVHLSKDIIDSDEFRYVQRQGRFMRQYVRAKSTPSPVLKGGVYLLPVQLVEEVQAKLDEMKVEFDRAADAFIEAYRGNGQESLVEQARKRLGQLFDEEDYPPASRLRAAFGVETAYISMETPSRLRSVSRALFESEKQKAEQRWRDLEEEVSGLLRAEMKNVVDAMVNSLTPKEDGKKRAFKGATVERLSEFLRTAPFRNVSDDAELEKIVGAASKLLDGIDPEIVRKDDFYRNELKKSMDMVKERVDKLVVEKPARMITFDEE